MLVSYKCFAFSTNPLTPMRTFAISPLASFIGFPVSFDSNVASLSLFSSTKSTNLYNFSALSYIDVLAHFFCSISATLAASSTSCSVTFGTVSINSCVAGFTTSIVAPFDASFHSYPIKFFTVVPSFFKL